MRVVSAALIGLAAAKENPGINTARNTLEDFKGDLTKAHAESAELWDQQACTFKDVKEGLEQAISDNQASHEEKEGFWQESKAIVDFLNDDKSLDGTIANSKMLLQTEQSTLRDLRETHKKEQTEAFLVMTEAEEAVKLINGAEDALKAASDSMDSHQAGGNWDAFLQLKTKLKALTHLRKVVDQIEQPSKHVSGNMRIVQMLGKLKTSVMEHLETTRKEWTERDNELLGLIQASETEIAALKQKIKNDTQKMETNRANMEKLDQEMHGLKVGIQTDTSTLKETTAAAKKAQDEFNADNMTRNSELQTVAKAIQLFNEKFGQVPETQAPSNKGEDGEAKPVGCDLQVPAVVSVPAPFGAVAPSESTFVQIKAVSKSFLARGDDDGNREVMSMLSQRQVQLKSVVLASVVSSIKKGDPMKKVRIMIKNLIQRLKDEALNEQARNEYCSTEETKRQEARTQQKKDMAKYETGLEKAQGEIAEYTAHLKKLSKQIKEAKDNCAAENGQLAFDMHLHQNTIDVSKHGKESLIAVLDVLRNEFFGDAAEGKVESGYKGNQSAGDMVMGLLEGLQADFQQNIDTSTEEKAKLNSNAEQLKGETKSEVENKSAEHDSMVASQLEPAIKEFNQNGQNLHQTAQDYSLTTEELIVLKYESEACKDTQLSVEEQAENKQNEIQSLKDALEILNNHGQNYGA